MDALRVLLTGSNGFAGRYVRDYLISCPAVKELYCIAGRKGDSTHGQTNHVHWENHYVDLCSSNLNSLLKDIDFDVVFHLAGTATNNPNQNDKLFDDNVLATHNLLTCCRRGTRLVYTSSANVYGDLSRNGKVDELSPTQVCSYYSATKLACEKLIEAQTSLGVIDSLILRPCAIAGPGQTHGVLKAFREKFLAEGNSIEVFGNYPGSIKPYIHINDCVRAIVNLGLDSRIKGIMNLSTIGNTTIETILCFFRKYSGKEKTWTYLGTPWRGDNEYVELDNSLLLKYIKLQYRESSRAVEQVIWEVFQ